MRERPLPLTHVISLSQLAHGLSGTLPLWHMASLAHIGLSRTDRPLLHTAFLAQIDLSRTDHMT